MKLKRIFAVITFATLFTAAAFGLSGCKQYTDIDVDLDFDELMHEPTLSAKLAAEPIRNTLQINRSSDYTQDAEVIADAVALYHLGDKNLRKAGFFACASKGNGGADILAFNLRGKMSIREMTIKDNQQWYYRSCGMVMGTDTLDGSSTNNGDSMLPLIRGILDYGKRKYSPDGKNFYIQTVSTGKLDENSINGFFSDDWVNAIKFSNDKKTKPTGSVYSFDNERAYLDYDAYRESYLEVDNSAITQDVITEAKIERDDQLGIFRVSFKVNVDSHALDTNLASLRASVADDLRYVYQTVNFELWDCGLFRTYGTDSSWATNKLGGILSGESQNAYTRYYTYNKAAVKKLVLPQEDAQELVNFCKNAK